jgi:hypothetical protein
MLLQIAPGGTLPHKAGKGAQTREALYRWRAISTISSRIATGMSARAP